MSSILLALPGPREARGGLWYSTPASTRFGRHHHRELELNVIVTGEACYWFPHRELRVIAPAVLWIPPLVEHELLDASRDLSMWVHSFRAPSGEEALGKPAARTLEQQSRLQTAWRELIDGPKMTTIAPGALAAICARSRQGLLRPRLPQFNDILSEIFALAWSAGCPPEACGEAAACHPAARHAARLLREPHIARSMEALARSTPLSRERLSRVFAHCFGIGMVQYRNHHRIQRFIHTYGHGSDANMLRAALDVGFGSYVQFHRAFKQVVGYPPTQHLERVREGIVDPARTGGSGECVAGHWQL
ncbi:MAG: helix-turn-helix domain-containing protein [Deltaproteobacteria bacterium]